MIREVTGLYFSPSGETAKITKKITREVAARLNEICIGEIGFSFVDFLRDKADHDRDFNDESVVVIGMPVYSGRIPEPCTDILKKMKGRGTLAIVIVSYGNNSYGDSLYELYTRAEESGFCVISAGAFISQHAIFKKVAEERPDAFDLEKIIEFSGISANKVKRLAGTEISAMRAKPAPLDIKGSMPTKKPVRVPIHPTANSFCIKCGDCAKICPMGAIDAADPKKVDFKKCISCTACITVCEQDARGFYGPLSAASRIALEKLFSKRKDPEWFI